MTELETTFLFILFGIAEAGIFHLMMKPEKVRK